MRRFLLVPLFLFLGSVSAQPLVLAVGEWPPYFSQALRENGVFAHIVKEAFAREGIVITYEFYPWARALSLAAVADRVAASPGWVQTPERSKDFLFSDPVLISQEVLFYRTDRPIAFTTIDDLKDVRIGAAIGYTYGPAFDEADKAGRLRVERTPSDDQNLRKLLAGRLDAVALNRVVGFELLSHFKPEERRLVTATDRSLSDKQSRMAVSKSLPNAEGLLKSFNQGLAELVGDGSVQRWLEAAEDGEYSIGP